MKGVAVFCLMSLVLVAKAEPGYTNHAGNVVAGWPVALTATEVTVGAGATTNHLLSTEFPRGQSPCTG